MEIYQDQGALEFNKIKQRLENIKQKFPQLLDNISKVDPKKVSKYLHFAQSDSQYPLQQNSNNEISAHLYDITKDLGYLYDDIAIKKSVDLNSELQYNAPNSQIETYDQIKIVEKELEFLRDIEREQEIKLEKIAKFYDKIKKNFNR